MSFYDSTMRSPHETSCVRSAVKPEAYAWELRQGKLLCVSLQGAVKGRIARDALLSKCGPSGAAWAKDSGLQDPGLQDS